MEKCEMEREVHESHSIGLEYETWASKTNASGGMTWGVSFPFEDRGFQAVTIACQNRVIAIQRFTLFH